MTQIIVRTSISPKICTGVNSHEQSITYTTSAVVDDTPVQMTLGALRMLMKLLEQFPDDLPVITEGCDCFGPCDGVTVYPSKDKTIKDKVVTGLYGVIFNRNDTLEH